jgi:hypothetical protein
VLLASVQSRAADDTDFALGYSSLWTHPLLIPSYFALLSIVILVAQAVLSSGPVRKFCGKDAPQAAPSSESGATASATGTGFVSAVKDHVRISGGSVIFFFQVTRLVAVLTLLSLEIFSFVQEEAQDHASPSSVISTLSKWGKKRKGKHRYGGSLTKREWLDLTLCLTYVRLRSFLSSRSHSSHDPNLTFTQLYAAFLALVTVTARRVRASITSFHLTSLLLGTFSVYAYRNIWPLLTFTLSPADSYEGALLWVKIGLLAFAAIAVPLLVPRQYIPIDPKVQSSRAISYFRSLTLAAELAASYQP